MSDKRPLAGDGTTGRSTVPAGRRRLESTALLGRGNELIIAHGPDEYRLRLTRQGKLILTK